MSDYKDKLTNNERRYLYSVPLLFLLGFGLFLLRFIIGMDVDFEINEKSGILINVLGAIILGYGLSSECTIVHFHCFRSKNRSGEQHQIIGFNDNRLITPFQILLLSTPLASSPPKR